MFSKNQMSLREYIFTESLLILIFFSNVVVMPSDVTSDEVNSLIYTLQHKYCGGLFCTLDPSYEPPVCQASRTTPFTDNASTPNPGQFDNTTTGDRNLTSHISRCDPCSECSCDESCRLLGNCCADINIGGKYFTDCEVIEKYTDGGTERDQYMVVTKCLPDAPYHSQDLAWKCQHGKLGHIQDGRPVTAPHPFNTSVTFRNKYCAMCYNITDYVAWNVYLSCDGEFDSSNSSDINSLIRSVQLTNICTVSLKLPHSPMPRYCLKPLISTCNVTGKWQEYNKSIETACESYFNPTRDWKYRNIFCYLCNGETHDELICPNCLFALHKPVIIRPFAALLNFENSDAEILKNDVMTSNYQIWRIGKQEAHQCREEDIYDKHFKKCREVYCPLTETNINATCVRLVPSQQHVLTIWNVTAYYYDEIIVPLGITPPRPGNAVIERMNDMIEDAGFFLKNAEVKDFASIYSPNNLIIGESQIHMRLFLFQDFSLEHSRGILEHNLTLEHDLVISWLNKEIVVKVVDEYRNITDRLLLFPGMFGSIHPEMMNTEWSKTIDVPLSFNVSCPMIRFASSDIETVNDSFVIYGYNTLNEDEYFVTKEGEYFICSDAVSREKNFITKTKYIAESADDLTQRIVTGVCLSCSLLFLLITMLVYIFIKELHTVPGLNLIFLTSSLFVAQALYLFGAGTVTTPTICTVIAVFIHYFWLVAFAWMNVCCVHMFRVFTNTFSSLDLANDKTCLMLRYSSFAFGIAALVVTLTIATTYVLSGHTTIAYGGPHLCFLTPGLASIVSFGIPAGLTVVINAILLIITTVHLRRSGKVNRHIGRTEANDISKFFKLSTITGLSWVFGFLGFFFKRVELMYTFTILTAGQGVFIFLSFVASRRILTMLRDKLGCFNKRRDKSMCSSDNRSSSSNSYSSEITKDCSTNL